MKKNIVFILLTFLLSSTAFAKNSNVNIYLFYASWNANSQKAQNITSTVVNSYKDNVGYKALDVDSEETYKFIKNNKLNIPKYVPSIVVVSKNHKIINTVEYKNQDENKLKSLIDGDVLPNI